MTIQRLDLGFIHGGRGGTCFQGHELAGTPRAPDAAIAHTADAGDATNLSSYTFSGVAIGAAAADRHVVVVVTMQQSGGGFPATPTVTVAGQSCTAVADIDNATAEYAGIFITDAPVTTGTTADVVVNEGSTQHNCGIGVFAATGLNSTTPTDTIEDITDPLSGTIDCDAGGFIVGVGFQLADSTFTWAGITEDFDGLVETTRNTTSGASGNFASAQTGLTVSATPSSFTRGIMVVASFR